MNSDESFENSTYADQIHMAERELASFIGAVTELFGPEQARLSADDWLEESELMDSPRRSTSREWRAVTVAASARLANRLTIARDHRVSLGTPPAASTEPRYRQYHRPIVSHPRFWCDALTASDAIGVAQRKKRNLL
jgi:hypothetical protein